MPVASVTRSESRHAPLLPASLRRPTISSAPGQTESHADGDTDRDSLCQVVHGHAYGSTDSSSDCEADGEIGFCFHDECSLSRFPAELRPARPSTTRRAGCPSLRGQESWGWAFAVLSTRSLLPFSIALCLLRFVADLADLAEHVAEVHAGERLEQGRYLSGHLGQITGDLVQAGSVAVTS